MELPRRGAEHPQDLPGISPVGNQDDAFSDAFADSRLLRLIEVWSALSDDVRRAIEALIESHTRSDVQNAVIVDRALSGDSAG